MPNITNYMESIQYDGTNAAFICGTWCGIQLVSETGSAMTVLMFADSEVEHVIPVNYWLKKDQPFPTEVQYFSPSVYVQRFVEIPPA